MAFTQRGAQVRLSQVAVAAALICLASVGHAQQAAGELREVVVTATGFEQELRAAPASISVVTREELQTRQFRDLAEALRNVEGIDVGGGTGKTGGLDISIRGMPSEYTLILVDGRRQNVAGDVTPNGFGSAHTSFMPPIAAIERIEVIRGPMSTLYGSDAMGGVVNIITRKVAKTWGGQVSVEAGIPTDSAWGNQTRANVYLSGPIKQDMLGLTVRGSVYQREASDWMLAPGTTQPSQGRNPAPAESDQYSGGVRLTLTPNRQHDVWLDVDVGKTWYNNDDGRLGTRDAAATNWTGNNPAGYRDALRFNREQIAIGHTARLGYGLLESSLMRTETETIGRTIPGGAIPRTAAQRRSVYWLSEADRGKARELSTTNVVLDSKFVAPVGDSHVLTVGGQWWDAEMVDGLLATAQSQKLWSVFAEDEWKLRPNLTATLGARYDRHSAFGGQVSPRGYLVWDATQNWTVKGGVSKGFKAPRLNQLIDGISGVSGQGATLNIGNPDLKPESSVSTELSALYDNRSGLNAGVTLFHNKIKDKISGGGDCAAKPISSCSVDPTASYSINVDQAKTYGLELNTRYQISERWAVKGGYTHTRSEVVEAGKQNGQLANTPKHAAHAQVEWVPSDKSRLWLRGEYRGKSPRFSGAVANLTGNNLAIYNAVGDIKSYALFHIGGSYQLSKNVSLQANIYNLFDKDFREYKQVSLNGTPTWVSPYTQTSSGVTGTAPQGRTLWLSANITF